MIVVRKGTDICRKPAVCWALSKHHLIQALLCKAGVIVPILQMSKLWSQEVMLPPGHSEQVAESRVRCTSVWLLDP